MKNMLVIRNYILTISLFMTVLQVNAQRSCCAVNENATDEFAHLAANNEFVDVHHEPLPFKLESAEGRSISFACNDGQLGKAWYIPGKTDSKQWIFVIHEWWGLNDYIKREAEILANELSGVHVLALDLYDGKVAITRDSAAKYMQSVSTSRAEAIILGALNLVGAEAEIATIGWCFGGGWSMQSSLLLANQAKACVIYYGMPEEDQNRLKTLQAPVLMIWPEKDKWINKEVVERFKENMTKAEKKLTVKSYAADHAFANPSNPHHDASFAADAHQHVLDLFKEAFDF